jgi:hypothetical protein
MMEEDYKRKGLPPNEDTARSQHPGKRVSDPDLVTVKDFPRFYVATSKSDIGKDRPTADSICTVGEWFFAGFTRVTEDAGEERRLLYMAMTRAQALLTLTLPLLQSREQEQSSLTSFLPETIHKRLSNRGPLFSDKVVADIASILKREWKRRRQYLAHWWDAQKLNECAVCTTRARQIVARSREIQQ